MSILDSSEIPFGLRVNNFEIVLAALVFEKAILVTLKVKIN